MINEIVKNDQRAILFDSWGAKKEIAFIDA